MKYKSNNYSHLNDPRINNMITTVNLKIKDIHILFDDINPQKNNSLSSDKQKSNSFKKLYNKKQLKLSSFSTRNSGKIYYNRRNNDSLTISHKSMRTIPIKIKRPNFAFNRNGSSQTLSISIDQYNNSHLTSRFSRTNNLSQIKTDRIIYSKEKNKNLPNLYSNNTIDNTSNKNRIYLKYFKDYRNSNKGNIYIKKTHNNKFRDKIFNSLENRKPLIVTSDSPGNYINNINNNNYIISNIELNGENNNIKKNKIKFNFNINDINKKHLLYVKSCIIIQKWWKNKKKRTILHYYIIMMQKVVRGYLLRKKIKSVFPNSYKDTKLLPKIIQKDKTFNKLYYISKFYYKNNLSKIKLLQKEIRKLLIKLKLCQNYHLQRNQIYDLSILYLKPKISICYISKRNNNKNKKLSFINKKIKFIAKNIKSKTIDIESKIDNSLNEFRNVNLHYNLQTFNSKKSQSIFNLDENKKDNYNNSNINSNNVYSFFQNFFKKNIIHKLYIILLKMKYNYINFYSFINAIFNAITKYNKRVFIQRLSFYYKIKGNIYRNRENLVNVILRHINIYKKSNNIKNEVIQLIEKILLIKNINNNHLNLNNKILFFISSKQENDLINSQLFKNDDRDLINYICLFFKYEKSKNFINFNFIQNRLIKEPLKYRNIFTITRYIDNLNDKINNNKICMKCFCKKNEKKCILNCNCHYIQNDINGNCFNNLLSKSKPRKGSLKKNKNNNNKENNIIDIFENKISEDNKENKNNDNKNSDCISFSNISENNYINKMNIKKAFSYFSKL